MTNTESRAQNVRRRTLDGPDEKNGGARKGTGGTDSPSALTRRRIRRAAVLVTLVVAGCLIAALLVLVPRGSIGPPVVKEPPPSALPERVVGGYWMKWRESNSVRLADIDPRYNVVYVSFAEGAQGTGALQFRQTAQPPEQFAEDLATLRARGQRVILSIGGKHGYVDMSTPQRRQQMVDSLIRIHREEVPFDGIDWDIEYVPFDVDAALEVSAALKEHFGPNLAITLAPPGGDRNDYKEMARRLGDDLGYIGVQYYDYPAPDQTERLAGVQHRTRELQTVYGIPADKIVIGMAVVDENTDRYAGADTTHYWTLDSSLQGWEELNKEFPGLRGVYLWEISGDAHLGGAWVANLAPAVGPNGQGAPASPR